MSTWIMWIAVGLLSLGLVLWMFRRLQRKPDACLPQPATFLLESPDPDVFTIRGFDFYVRLDPARKGEMLTVVRNATGNNGTVYDQDSHAVVLWSDFWPPEDLLAQLSRELPAEVIWLAFQKQVDAFGYQRWIDGKRIRRLTFGCYEKERTWEEVDGTPKRGRPQFSTRQILRGA